MGQRLPKADRNFSILTDANLIARAQSIHDGVLANVAIFAAPPVTMAAIQTDIDNYKDFSAAAVKGSKTQTAAKNEAKKSLINDLRSTVEYVNMVVNNEYYSNGIQYEGLKTIVLLSGASLQKDPNPVASNIGIMVPIVRRAVSDQIGTLSILLRQYERFKRGTKIWQVQYRTSAIPGTVPVPAGEWVSDTFTSGNININGLDSGKYYDYQIAAVGGRDVKLNNENPINWTRIQSIVII